MPIVTVIKPKNPACITRMIPLWMTHDYVDEPLLIIAPLDLTWMAQCSTQPSIINGPDYIHGVFNLLGSLCFSLLCIIHGQLRHEHGGPWRTCRLCSARVAHSSGQCQMRMLSSKSSEKVGGPRISAFPLSPNLLSVFSNLAN